MGGKRHVYEAEMKQDRRTPVASVTRRRPGRHPGLTRPDAVGRATRDG